MFAQGLVVFPTSVSNSKHNYRLDCAAVSIHSLTGLPSNHLTVTLSPLLPSELTSCCMYALVNNLYWTATFHTLFVHCYDFACVYLFVGMRIGFPLSHTDPSQLCRKVQVVVVTL